jgi:tetraacyldisaccharide 4'-kinase
LHEVGADDDACLAGDEPLLIRRRTGVPVWVGRDRVAAAHALCARHADVDVLVSDDGLQHHALARAAELVVFDERGAGNGLLLPAGPLREPLPVQVPPRMRVLYTSGRASTALRGAVTERQLGAAWPLQAWLAGDPTPAVPLASLRGRPLVAAAGIAAPEKFFTMLDAAGLTISRLPLPDHHPYATLPWAPATPDAITTEKDAIKLDPARLGATRLWVVPLDLHIAEPLIGELIALLFPPRTP